MTFLRVLSVATNKTLAVLVVIAFTCHSVFAVWCFGRHAAQTGMEVEGHGCFIFDCVEDSSTEVVRVTSTSTFSDRLIYALAATVNSILSLYFIRGHCEGHDRYNATFLRGSTVTLPVGLVLCVGAAWTGSSTYELTFVKLGLLLHLPIIMMAIINLELPIGAAGHIPLVAASANNYVELQVDANCASKVAPAQKPIDDRQSRVLAILDGK